MLSKLKRNNTYRWAWLVMVFGGLAFYGPIVMLYPFSYMGIGAFYVKVTKSLSGFNFLYNMIVSILLYYAGRLWLYEDDLEKWVVQLEFWSYVIIVWVMFWMTRVAYWPEFEAFYLHAEQEIVDNTVEPPPPASKEVDGEKAGEGEEGDTAGDGEDGNVVEAGDSIVTL